ncbi:MAG: transposase [Alphaproteobacteria bacterium]|nr:transposase [Alphaproteobacteria bacterium]
MQTECIPDLFGFAPVERRHVVASFDGGTVTSDAGALLLLAVDRAVRLVERFAAGFSDTRKAEAIEHGYCYTGGSIIRLAGGHNRQRSYPPARSSQAGHRPQPYPQA